MVRFTVPLVTPTLAGHPTVDLNRSLIVTRKTHLNSNTYASRPRCPLRVLENTSRRHDGECGHTSAQAGAPETAAPPPAGAVLGPEPAKPVPAQLPDVLARVNGEAVNKAELDRAVAALEARNGGPVPAQQRDRVLRDVLDQIVAYRLLIQESRARKIAVDDAEVDARMKEIQGQFPSEDAFKQMLTSRKTTLEQVRADIRQDMTVQKLIASADRRQGGGEARAGRGLLCEEPGSVQTARARAGEPHSDHGSQGRRRGSQGRRAHEGDRHSEGREGRQGLRGARQGAFTGPRQRARTVATSGSSSRARWSVHSTRSRSSWRPARSAISSRRSSASTSSRSPRSRPARTVPLDEVRPQLEQYLERRIASSRLTPSSTDSRPKGKIEILI